MGSPDRASGSAQFVQIDGDATIPESAAEGAALGLPASLMVYHHDGTDIIPLVPEKSLLLGRDTEADICVRAAQLSRRHARFDWDGTTLVVHDIGSTNGVLLNGRRVNARARLKVGDELRLGAVVVLVTSLEANTVRGRLAVSGTSQLVEQLEVEIRRARAFRRPMALVMFRAAGAVVPSHRWGEQLRAVAREVDHVGAYQPDQVGVVVAEGDASNAETLATMGREALGDELPVFAGIAVFPGAGGTAQELLEVACSAAARARPSEPVVHGGAPDGHSVIDVQVPDGEVVLLDPAMRALHQSIRKVAAAPVPILLLGETGTGKEVLARTIHQMSKRAGEPLHIVNCGALQPSLMESFLFGYEKGAFTGATKATAGIFEVADGSTVFMDEVGELSIEAQAALLRVLDGKQILRVGSTRPIAVDVRLIAATNRDLDQMVKEGRFRLDLLHRINVITLKIPPLRLRPVEILPLCEHFVDAANHRYDTHVGGISEAARELLVRYGWPGNIRELRNVMDRAVLTTLGTTIEPLDLPEDIRDLQPLKSHGGRDRPRVRDLTAAAESIDDPVTTSHSDIFGQPLPTLKSAIRAVEKVMVHRALVEAEGSRHAAAAALRVPRRTLNHKIATQRLGGEPTEAQQAIVSAYSKEEDRAHGMRACIEQVERRLLEEALRQAQGDATEASRVLHMDRRTLVRRAEKYGL